MKALIQRVSAAKVWISEGIASEIAKGLVVFLGVTHHDTPADAAAIAAKTAHLRIFPDAQDRMNHSVVDITGEILVVSQFTLYADTRKGKRPSFINAAAPDQAEMLYNHYVQNLTQHLSENLIKTGRFRASMQVELTNDGPVTIALETDKLSHACI